MMNKFRDIKKRQLLAIILCLFLIVTSFSSFAISQSTSLALQENKEGIGLSGKDSSFVPEDTVVKLLASDKSGLTIENTIDRDDLKTESVQIGEVCYQKLVLPGYVSTMEVGKPQILIKSQMVAIPESVEDVEYEILSSTYSTLSGVSLCPVPEMVEQTSSPDGYVDYDEVFTIDNVCYATDTFYPGPLVEISGFSHIRDQRVVRLVFQPFQYNPVTHELQVYTSIQVEIQYSSPADLVIKNVGPLESICSNLIVNYEPPQTPSLDYQRGTQQGNVSYPSDLSDHGNSADYLIITSNKFYAPVIPGPFEINTTLNEFAYWRAAYNGFDVAVVNVNDSFIGGNTDSNIKRFIEHAYNNWSAPHMTDGHVGYILLVGDTPFVTTHLCWFGIEQYAADRWYVCIGDEDYNTPDIMIGRFSVDDKTELDVIARKTIHYEQTYSDTEEWHKKVMMVEGTINLDESIDWYSDWYSTTKETLLGDGGWNVSEVFADEGGNASDIIENINSGIGILVCIAHGVTGGWEDPLLWESHIPLLANGDKLPVVYSMSCYTGSFQESYDCFGEIFVNTPDKGAVAFLGASESTNNIFYSMCLFPSLFEHFEYILGRIIMEAIMQIPSGWGAGEEYNLLGDPALDLSGSKGYFENEKPDLALSHLNITIDPEAPQPGEEVNITATILNIGGGTAENVAVRFIKVDYNNTQYIIGDETVSSVSPGGSCMVHHLWNTSGYYGQYSLIVQIDPENTIDESYELNNQAGGITILPFTTYVNSTYDEATPGFGDTHFKRIQDGINGVASTGTVFVSQGTYQEYVTITKPVHLFGEDMASTFIDGGGSGPAVAITSTNEVIITGFTIRNSGVGVDLYSVQGTTISGNIISDNLNSGLRLLYESTGNTISNNYFVNDGVDTTESYNNTFSGNTINGRPLVYLEEQSDVVIDSPDAAGQVILIRCTNITVQNQDISNIETGITLLETTSCHITGNTISNNSDSGICLYFDSSYNTISENIISNNNNYGILLTEVGNENNTITSNTLTHNNYGIYLGARELSVDPVPSLPLDSVQGTTISGNIISDNFIYGLFLSGSTGNNVSNNYFVNDGVGITDSYHNTFSGNTVNGKPLVYLEEQSDVVIDSPDAAGQVILIRCTNITVQNQAISNTETGITLLETTSCHITGNTITYNNYDGIYLSSSNSNTISENIISNNINYGIRLVSSNSNTISGNTITYNYNGIYLSSSNSNTISGNTITYNYNGIYLSSSNSNTISGNTISNNSDSGIWLYSILFHPSINNRIYHNNFINNTQQAYDDTNSTKNFWNDTYPSGGNYWDNYQGSDNYYKFFSQFILGSDGIGDTRYNISGGSNYDLYPLMYPWPWIPGDLNHDGDVDDDDFTIFEASYGLSYGDPHYNIRADYDGDNNITLADYVIWLGYYRSFLQLPGDLDHDYDIDEDDYAMIHNAIGHSIGDPLFNPEADYNSNGVVDLVDYQIWIMYYRDFVTSHTDILISGLSANYTSNASTSFSAVNSTPITIKLTATIKNNGVIDITTPFQVTFRGSSENVYSKLIKIGTVEIPSLIAGESTKITVAWRLQPDVRIVTVIADSAQVINESDESNNQASMMLPSYNLWKSLKVTQEMFTKLNQQYIAPSALKVVTLTEKAIRIGVYANPNGYLEHIKTIAEIEFYVGDELKGQVPDDILGKYQDVVKHLMMVIDSIRIDSSSDKSIWDDAQRISEIQLQVCEIVSQMVK